jgi:DNA-binding transcriptional LysR family regulator
MRLRHLEVIWAVSRCRSMREAAIMLGVTQPSLSQSLKHAENLLGYELFSRERGRLIPTPELRAMMPDLERVFLSVGAIRSRSVNMRNDQSSEIRVAAIPALTSDWLAKATVRFRRRHPRAVIRIQSTTSREVVDAVLTHKADIGLVHGPIVDAGLHVTKLADNTIVAVLHRAHPLASQEEVSVRDLRSFDVISLGMGNMPGDLTSAAFRRANAAVPISVQLIASVSAIIFAREGAGVALIDSRTAETFAMEEVVVRPFVPRVTLEAEVIAAQDRLMTAHTTTFLNILRDAAQEAAPVAGDAS